MAIPDRIALAVALAAFALLGAVLAARAMAFPIPLLSSGKVGRVDLPPARAFGLPPVAGPGDPSQPLVVIDPGHGGFDYGARAPGYDEKQLTLALALALRDRLVADGGVRVALTRETDRFVSLAERYEIARRLGAAVFVSIHADSAGADAGRAEAVSGASVYTLSDRASDAAARRYALRENAAGSVNGQSLSEASDAVSAILVDLSQRRTQAASERLADLIVEQGRGTLAFLPDPKRSAALEVLRAPDVPSVLFESGYITNPEDAARLASDSGRADFARVMGRAIRLFLVAQRIAARQEAATGEGAPAASSAIASPPPAP